MRRGNTSFSVRVLLTCKNIYDRFRFKKSSPGIPIRTEWNGCGDGRNAAKSWRFRH